MKSLPLVCIIGRPNVGKSTLFNRLVGKRLAVVDPTSGVTRDRLYAEAEWGNRRFALVDTGGLVYQGEDLMEREIRIQSEIAIEEADVVILVLDGRATLHADDEAIARSLWRSNKPAVVAVNKLDSERAQSDAYEFTRIGPVEPLGISALHGLAVTTLLDRVVSLLPEPAEPGPEDERESIGLAIVGRPNVGKSSLVNRLLGEERMIVSPIAGTTRDSVDSILDVGDTRFVLIDTAGLRRASRVHEDLEFYTALRSVRAIQRADVVCVMLDADTPLGAQDFKIAETAAESGKAIFFAINKWDLIEKDEKTAGIFVRDLQARGYAFSWAPILFLSALSGQRAVKTLDMARSVLEESRKRIPTNELNETILQDIRDKPPPAIQGKFIKINYVTQAEAQPPTFIIFCNHPELISEPYSRFVIKRIRERYGFSGAPVRIWWRRKGKKGEG